MNRTRNGVTWLELNHHDGVPEWVLHEDDDGSQHVTAAMPAPPARGRSPQELARHDAIEWWVARQVGAAKVWLRRVEGGPHPTWRVVARRITDGG